MPTCLGLHMLAERQAMHKTFEIPLDIPDVMIEKVGTDRHGDFVMTVKSTIEGTHCPICGKKITKVYGDDREITLRHVSILGRKTFTFASCTRSMFLMCWKPDHDTGVIVVYSAECRHE